MKPHQLAAQLYTVRDFCRTAADFATTLKKLRKIGYPAVQLSGVGPIPLPELKAILDGEGMICCATHEDSAQLLAEPARCIEKLQFLDCRHTAYPWPAGIDFGSAASVESLAARLNESGKLFRAAGLTLGYHNHAIEFVPFRGTTVLDYIYNTADAQNLVAEPDTFWIHYGGGDVVAWCERLAGRMPCIHLKDYGFTLENKHQFCEVGRGNLNWRRILAAAEKSGCQWFIVEQDTCPGDPFDSLKISYDYLRANFAQA